MVSKVTSVIDSNSQRITASSAESHNYSKPLQCEYCGAIMSFVNGYTKAIGEDTIYIKPFFRLKIKSRHGENCKFNVTGQVNIIARKSSSSIINENSSGNFELRLLAVKKAINELIELSKEKKKYNNNSFPSSIEKKYIESETRLSSYINSATQVLKVRHFCESNSEIADVLKLDFDGIKLSWDDFYYEEDEHFRCFNNVSNSTVKVPVAIKGTIKSKKSVDGKNSQFEVLNLIGPYRSTSDKHTLDAINFSIWSPDLNMFEDYEQGMNILAFGLWGSDNIVEASNSKTESNIKFFRNYQLRLWPVSKKQICKL